MNYTDDQDQNSVNVGTKHSSGDALLSPQPSEQGSTCRGCAAFANAIGEAAIRVGIIDDATPFTNAELITLCDGLATEANRAAIEASEAKLNFRAACEHGQVLSKEVDRLRAVIRDANKAGFEILEMINSGGVEH